MGDIVHTLTNRRYLEKCIAYAESHDQVNEHLCKFLSVCENYLHLKNILKLFSKSITSSFEMQSHFYAAKL